MGENTRRNVIRSAAAGYAVATGMGAATAEELWQVDDEQDQENGQDDALMVTEVTTADYHRGEFGDYEEQDEFERGDSFQVVMGVDNLVHDDEMSIAFSAHITFGPVEVVDSFHHDDAGVGVESPFWEYWTPSIDTSGWGVGDYEAAVTVTDLIEGTCDTETTTFRIM